MSIDRNKAKMALQFPKAMDALVREYDVQSANALSKLPVANSAPVVTFVNGTWVHQCRKYWYNAATFPTEKAALAALPKVQR